MFSPKHFTIGVFILLMTGALLAGCSDDDPAGPGTVDVDTYVRQLPGWDTFSPPLASADISISLPDSTEETVAGQVYNCETTNNSITRTPEKIVTMNPDSEILWPGVLLQGKGYVKGIGSLAELPIRERAPVTLSIDLLTGDNTRTVKNPTLATVNQAIGSLVETAQNGGHTAGSNVLYTKERMHSVSQGLLRMGLSAQYTGVEVAASLEVGYSVERTNITAYFVQRMFTVSVVLPSTPGEVFSAEFTDEMLADEISRGRIGEDNLPVYVSNITYGRMLVFSFSSESTEAQIRATLNIVLESGGQGGGAELTAEQRALLETAQIQVVTVGGDASHALALIRSGDLSDFFTSDAPLTTARPISYSIRNLADNTLAKVSETTEYSVSECTAADLVPTGARYRITMQQLSFAEGEGLCVLECPLITAYDFWVTDASGQQTAAHWNPVIGSPICNGARWDFDGTGPPPGGIEVDLHLDGRDSVRLFGSVSNILPVWEWDITFRNTMVVGNRGSSRWDTPAPHNCVRLGITYNVQKVSNLYD